MVLVLSMRVHIYCTAHDTVIVIIATVKPSKATTQKDKSISSRLREVDVYERSDHMRSNF